MNCPVSICVTFEKLYTLEICLLGLKRKAKVVQSCPTLCYPLDYYSPWNSPGQSIGVGSLSLLQGIFPTQGWNPGLPHCRWILYQLSHQGLSFDFAKYIRQYSARSKCSVNVCCSQLLILTLPPDRTLTR